MATFAVQDLSFTYPNRQDPALSHLSLSVEYGEFVLICGQTGCGKSTLLRNLKTVLTPYGKKEGEIMFYGRPIGMVEQREQASRIGYVLQDPDNQIVTDKVWHELAFGLESLGLDKRTIRMRVAEMASFFGIQSWYMRDVSQLSGGQKQVLNLASIMAMHPDVLILDEPTSQLDPIAAGDFLNTVRKINREIGTTVIMTEHRLEDVLPMADRVIVLDKGRKIADDRPEEIGRILSQLGHPMLAAMPTPMQVCESLRPMTGSGPCPVTVREGRNWLTDLFADKEVPILRVEDSSEVDSMQPSVIELSDVWFRYSREDVDVIKGLSLKVPSGKLLCIVGGNGTGKTTALSLIVGSLKPYRGTIQIKGQKMTKHFGKEKYNTQIVMLPQNPQTLFVEKTVRLDLHEMLEKTPLSETEKAGRVHDMALKLEISDLLDCHPHDLSGGEQQRVAMAKVLLLEPEILLLDEPTKGLDSHYKEKLASIFQRLLEEGKTILIVSHDIEFCGKYGDLCAMFFDGGVLTTNTPNHFFSGNSFYTTAANRMSLHIFENAVTTRDVIDICQRNLELALE